jgi:peptidoglycan-N-acetylglucosamine deacetylase
MVSVRGLTLLCLLAVGVHAADAKVSKKKPAPKPKVEKPKAETKPEKPVQKGWPTPAAGESASGDVELLFTFDDGPNPATTPAVLDILAQHHIKAVFFLVGEMAGNENKKVPGIIHRMLRDGHVIATHTMTHKDLCKLKDPEKAAREIDLGRETVERVAGIKTAWFRTPYGVRCARLDEMLAERHLQHFHWDLDPQEWKHKSADKAYTYVTDALSRTGDRNVLLMHDIHEATVKALPRILDWIDEENAKRKKSHKKPILIVQAPAYAIEKLPKGFVPWITEATAGIRALPSSIASVLP